MDNSENKTRKRVLTDEDIGDILEVGDENYAEGRFKFDYETILKQYPEGLVKLLEGYLAYGAEVIINRAVPGIDGLKPVQRRILYTAFVEKCNKLVKSQKFCGTVLKYHPHSDAPVYEALTRLIDKKGIMNVPLFSGKGTFGKVYSQRKPSASRYTEVVLNENATEYYGQLNGVDYVSNFDETDVEPTLLPVSFPSILVNPTQGIAVGLASIIPSFNVLDVIDLAIEYLETGDIKTVIRPDHRESGAFYIEDYNELYKVMTKGVGKLKFRGKVEIHGKDIVIKELPFGVASEKLKKQIADLDLQGVVDVCNYSDQNGLNVTVTCSSASKTNSVLLALYKNTDLQTTITTNMTVIVDNEPRLLGVWDIIKVWCDSFRKEVFRKQYTYDNEVLKKKLLIAEARVKFLQKTDICDKYINLVRDKGKRVAKEYLREVFTDLSDEELSAITSLSLSQLGDLEQFTGERNVLSSKINANLEILKDLKPTMIADLKRVRGRFAGMTRRTEITDVDYVFEKENTVIIDDSPCTVLYKDGFIKKISYTGYIVESEYSLLIKAKANDTLIGVDAQGRVLRVYLSQIDYCSTDDIGTYLPKYFGLEESNLLWLDKLDGTEKLILYSDGRVSFLDTSVWYGNKRQVKVIEVGISNETDKLVDIQDTPYALAVITRKGFVGVAYADAISKVSRTARTSVFKLDTGDTIKHYAYLSMTELKETFNNVDRYVCYKTKPKALVEKGDLLSVDKFVTIG